MKRILGERPESFSPSTGVADKVVQVEIVGSSTKTAIVSGSTWVKLSPDKEAATVVMDTALSQTAPSHSTQTAHSEPHSQKPTNPARPVSQSTTASARRHLPTQSKSAIVSEHRNQPQSDLSPTASTQPDLSPTASTQPDPSSTASTQPDLPSLPCLSAADLKPALELCRNTLLRNVQYARRASQEQGLTVYLTDTGGQIEFHELLPLLVSGPSVFFLVFRLDHDLNKRFEVEYVCSIKEKSEPYQSSFTLKETLLQSLASIASMGRSDDKGERIPLDSKVFFVGTYKDKLTEKQIDRIDLSLKRMVESTGLYRDIIQHASDSRMLLAVNNLSDDESDVQDVRTAVEQVGSQECFVIKARSSWLIFSLAIRQETNRVLSWEHCYEVARHCGIKTPEELNKALSFLHTEVGLIRHFQGEGLEDLQKIVIQDPRVLFEMNTNLVVGTFTFEKAGKVTRDDFKMKGIFPDSIIENISGSSLLTPSLLVKLLEHLRIIAPLEMDGEKKYFMPCVLAHAKPATSWFKRICRKVTSFFAPSDPSLLIGFRCGYCPKGLFTTLVAYLLANTDFKWELHADRIFRDQITFYIRPFGDTVTITVQPKFLEIAYTPESTCIRNSPLATTCVKVREIIETGIRKVTSDLHYTTDAAHYPAFYCPGGRCFPGGQRHQCPELQEPHPAEINFDERGKPCGLTCGLAEKKETFILPHGYKMWYPEVCSCMSFV